MEAELARRILKATDAVRTDLAMIGPAAEASAPQLAVSLRFVAARVDAVQAATKAARDGVKGDETERPLAPATCTAEELLRLPSGTARAWIDAAAKWMKQMSDLSGLLETIPSDEERMRLLRAIAAVIGYAYTEVLSPLCQAFPDEVPDEVREGLER